MTLGNNSRGKWTAAFTNYLDAGGMRGVARKRRKDSEQETLADKIEKALDSPRPMSPGGRRLYHMIAARIRG